MKNAGTVQWVKNGRALLVSVDNNAARFARGPADPAKRRLALVDSATGAVTDLGIGVHPHASADGDLILFDESYQAGAQPLQVTSSILDVGSGTVVGHVITDGGTSWLGHDLYYVANGEIRRWRMGADELVRAIPHAAAAAVISLSGDARVALVQSWARPYAPMMDYALFDVATGVETRLEGAWAVWGSPEGHRFVVMYEGRTVLREEDGTIRTIDRATSNVFWPGPADPLFEPVIAGASGIDYRPYKELRVFDGAAAGVVVPSPAWKDRLSPDRSMLAVAYNDGWGTVEARIYRCAPRAPVGSAQMPDTVTLYYAESNTEPWAASPSGSAVPDWREWARHDIAATGLHPLSIERVMSAPPSAVETCVAASCSNGYTLAVTFPYAELEHALQRCFFTGDPPRYVPYYPAVQAETYYECQALYHAAKLPSPLTP